MCQDKVKNYVILSSVLTKVLISCCQDNSEVHFKIKRTTQLKKLMNAYCDRQVCASYESLKILYKA